MQKLSRVARRKQPQGSQTAGAARAASKPVKIVGGARYRLRNGALVKVERLHTLHAHGPHGAVDFTVWRGHIVGTKQRIHWTPEGTYGANYVGHDLDIVKLAR